jgi:signal transduction histidine kinase
VAAEERGRLFDRFYRGGDVRHQGTPGSGLGLSRARTIVKLHGGTIALVDNEPAGTIAVIRLPDPQATTAGTPQLPPDA